MGFKHNAVVLFWFLGLAAEAAIVRDGNRFVLAAPSGRGGFSIEFASPVTFQYEAWFNSSPPSRGVPLSPDSMAIELQESPDGTAVLSNRYLKINVRPSGEIQVTAKSSGRELGGLAAPPTPRQLRFESAPGEMYFGAGATHVPQLDLRGTAFRSRHPLLLSSRGYGLFVSDDDVGFDLAKSDPKVAVMESRRAGFLFYYGPNPKEILEQHVLATRTQVDLQESAITNRDEKRLPKGVERVAIDESNYCQMARILSQLSLSGVLFPALDLAKLGSHEKQVQLLPFLYDSKAAPHPELERRRSAWEHYYNAYLREAHDRGLPFVRPLMMEFPQDKGMEARSDVFLLGDEILLVPGCNATEVELPRGSWTDLRDYKRYPGRQKIAVQTRNGEIPIFAKSGSLIPLNSSRSGVSVELHYFPTLGAEFFVFEPQLNDYSQFHAAPAGDYWRVESESKVERTYEWILHDVPSKPKTVGETGRAFREAQTRADCRDGSWFFDKATGMLHIVVTSRAGEDHIVNMTF